MAIGMKEVLEELKKRYEMRAIQERKKLLENRF